MDSKVKAAKQSVIKFFAFETIRNLYQKIRWKNMSRRRRIWFLVLITVLPSLAILLGILCSCIYGIDYHTNAIAVNDSIQRFEGDLYHNQIIFRTLATRLKKFPSGYFQISFSDQKRAGSTNYPSINTRTIEGTPLKIDLFVTAKLNVNDYKAFYQKYGEDWMSYLKIKIPNIISRTISNIGFYSLSNKEIRLSAQTQLNSFDEFNVNIVNVGVQLPNQYLSQVNGTIGWNVFQKNAKLVMLKQTLSALNSYITDNSLLIQAQFQNLGKLQAQKDFLILNQTFYNSTTPNSDITQNWIDGTNSFYAIGGTQPVSSSLLWYYFQSYYNSSFNTQHHQIQFN